MNLYNEVVNAIKINKDERESFLTRSLAHEDLIKIQKLLTKELKDSVIAMGKNET